jgi:hypothetical protein
MVEWMIDDLRRQGNINLVRQAALFRENRSVL